MVTAFGYLAWSNNSLKLDLKDKTQEAEKNEALANTRQNKIKQLNAIVEGLQKQSARYQEQITEEREKTDEKIRKIKAGMQSDQCANTVIPESILSQLRK